MGIAIVATLILLAAALPVALGVRRRRLAELEREIREVSSEFETLLDRVERRIDQREAEQQRRKYLDVEIRSANSPKLGDFYAAFEYLAPSRVHKSMKLADFVQDPWDPTRANQLSRYYQAIIEPLTNLWLFDPDSLIEKSLETMPAAKVARKFVGAERVSPISWLDAEAFPPGNRSRWISVQRKPTKIAGRTQHSVA